MAFYHYDDTNFNLKYQNPKRTLPNGATFDEIDLHATLADPKNKANLAAWTGFDQFMTDYIKGYDQLDGSTQRHAAAITALQEISMKMQFPVDTC
jgi:hypothetical protein